MQKCTKWHCFEAHLSLSKMGQLHLLLAVCIILWISTGKRILTFFLFISTATYIKMPYWTLFLTIWVTRAFLQKRMTSNIFKLFLTFYHTGAQRINRISPYVGSVNGGTRLTIEGEGIKRCSFNILYKTFLRI